MTLFQLPDSVLEPRRPRDQEMGSLPAMDLGLGKKQLWIDMTKPLNGKKTGCNIPTFCVSNNVMVYYHMSHWTSYFGVSSIDAHNQKHEDIYDTEIWGDQAVLLCAIGWLMFADDKMRLWCFVMVAYSKQWFPIAALLLFWTVFRSFQIQTKKGWRMVFVLSQKNEHGDVCWWLNPNLGWLFFNKSPSRPFGMVSFNSNFGFLHCLLSLFVSVWDSFRCVSYQPAFVEVCR